MNTDGQPIVTGNYASPVVGQPVATQQNRRNNNQYAANGFNNLLGAGLMAGANYAAQKSQKDLHAWQQSHGATDTAFSSQRMIPGSHGDYTPQGIFKPDQQTVIKPGMQYAPVGKYGGQYTTGSEHELDDMEIQRLTKAGYKLQYM